MSKDGRFSWCAVAALVLLGASLGVRADAVTDWNQIVQDTVASGDRKSVV